MRPTARTYTLDCPDVSVGKTRFKLGNGSDESVTISVGVTQYEKGEDLNQLLNRAETAIHQAKNQGRNAVVSA